MKSKIVNNEGHPKKDEILNIESYGRTGSHLDVYTKRDRFGNIYYMLFVGSKKKSGKWNNQLLLVSDKDINILESLIRKSTLFSCTLKASSDSVIV
jgi:hypothetical protein